MSAPNPQVSVFHFSSKISKAKIQKYKLATERGMAPDLANADHPKPFAKRPNGKHAVTAAGVEQESGSPLTGSPPAKKPRLTLHVRPQSGESPGDTITVSQPKRAPIKYRFQHDIFINSGKEDHQKAAASPSLSPPITVKSSTPEKEPEPQSTRDDYGDFMSYYIAGGDEDKGLDQGPAKPARRTKSLPTSKTSPKIINAKSLPPKPAPLRLATKHRQRSEIQKAPSEAILPNDAERKILQNPRPAPPQPPMLPQPTIQFIDIPPRPRPSRPDTIAEMIGKLQKLSRALTDFGGVPSMPETPPEETAGQHASALDDEVDGFLAQFEGSPEVKDLDVPLSASGQPDGALSYGIQFIQNALQSWAQQRLTLDVMQRLQMQQQQTSQMHHQQMLQTQRLGRPRKYTGDVNPLDTPFLHGPIQMHMADTPEGAAIAAFQAVLDSGCLRVNGILPVELTRALRHLYMQIDHLINQGSKIQTPWTCMSYQAQITAHKIRVDKWKDAQAKMQEEMARQQQIAQQHTMIQMGLHGSHPPIPLDAAQAQHAHAIELERRRSLQHAAQQPYISQHHLNPLQLSAQHAPEFNMHTNPATANNVPPNAPFEGSHVRNQTPSALNAPKNHTFTAIPNPAQGANRASAGQVHLDKMKLYMPGFLPRSGQSMKFSFAPHSETALRVFGSQAFPTMPEKSSIPNRGPMGMAPPQSPLPGRSETAAKPSPSAEAAPPLVPVRCKNLKSPDTDHQRGEQVLVETDPPVVPKSIASGLAPTTAANGITTPEVVQLDGSASPMDEDTIHVAMKPASRMTTVSSTPAPDSG